MSNLAAGSKLIRLTEGDTWKRGTSGNNKEGIDHVVVRGAANITFKADNVFDVDGAKITTDITEDIEDDRFELNPSELTVNSGDGVVYLVRQ